MEYGTLARVASKQNFTYNQQIKSHKSNLQPSVNFQQHVSKAAQHILATNTESRIRSLSTVLFSDCPSKWPYILSSFDEAAHTMGLNTSWSGWSKTKIQNLGHGVTPAPVQLQGHVVESTDRFTYLGSDPLVRAFHPRDTQAYWSSFKYYFRQTRQHLEADRIEFTDEDTALQCPCHLRTVIWL